MNVSDLSAWGKLVWKALSSILAHRRKQLHLFVLKAITSYPWTNPQFDKPLTLQKLAERITSAQVDYEVGDLTIGQRMGWNYITKRQQKTVAGRKSFLKSIGLPDRNGPNYEEKIEGILQQMVAERKLKYHPPDKYSLP